MVRVCFVNQTIGHDADDAVKHAHLFQVPIFMADAALEFYFELIGYRFSPFVKRSVSARTCKIIAMDNQRQASLLVLKQQGLALLLMKLRDIRASP